MRHFSVFLSALFLGAALLCGGASAQENPIRFYADLTVDQEPMMIESKGTARAEFTLDRNTLKFTWKLTYSGLTSPPVGIHIHFQKPGVVGTVLYDIGAKGGMKNPLEGSVNMTEGELLYLMERHVYIDIHTVKYKDGELRGHLEKVPPAITQ